jgi:hypothetical protein
MNIRRLKKKLRRQARREYRAGRMTGMEFNAAMRVSDDYLLLNKLNKYIEEEVNPWNRADGLIGASWSDWFSSAWDWFVQNWPTILRFIITIAPLLLLEPKHEDQ